MRGYGLSSQFQGLKFNGGLPKEAMSRYYVWFDPKLSMQKPLEGRSIYYLGPLALGFSVEGIGFGVGFRGAE